MICTRAVQNNFGLIEGQDISFWKGLSLLWVTRENLGENVTCAHLGTIGIPRKYKSWHFFCNTAINLDTSCLNTTTVLCFLIDLHLMSRKYSCIRKFKPKYITNYSAYGVLANTGKTTFNFKWYTMGISYKNVYLKIRTACPREVVPRGGHPLGW